MPGVTHRCEHVFCKTLWSGSDLTDGQEPLLTLGAKRTGPSIHLGRQVQKAAEEVRHRWGSSPRWCGRCPSGTWARAGPGCPITREPSSSRRSVIKAGATALMKTQGEGGCLPSVMTSNLVHKRQKFNNCFLRLGVGCETVLFILRHAVSPLPGDASGGGCVAFSRHHLSLAPRGHTAKKLGSYNTHRLLLG